MYSFDQTTPSGESGGVPRGEPALINLNDDSVTIRALTWENESAVTLANAGYDIEQQPSVPGSRKNPDDRKKIIYRLDPLAS